MKDSIKREQSQMYLNSAERENLRLLGRLYSLTLPLSQQGLTL